MLFLTCIEGAYADESSEPFLKPNDVIALVGGEDMVAASECGYLELLLTRALPTHKLKFRCLAWEGDTVFEQRRDLNYPTLEQQLDTMGATVVIAQFGQMESLAGKEKLPAFIAAYEKLIERLEADEKRRTISVSPTQFTTSTNRQFLSSPEVIGFDQDFVNVRNEVLGEYRRAISTFRLATRRRIASMSGWHSGFGEGHHLKGRDGVHVAEQDLEFASLNLALSIESERVRRMFESEFQRALDHMHGKNVPSPAYRAERMKKLHAVIREKNRLWFHYYRPQNWAFLAGDRTNQPSSRDHRDPSKRWFPEELEQFLPLIEKKETEIWKMSAELAKEK